MSVALKCCIYTATVIQLAFMFVTSLCILIAYQLNMNVPFVDIDEIWVVIGSGYCLYYHLTRTIRGYDTICVYYLIGPFTLMIFLGQLQKFSDSNFTSVNFKLVLVSHICILLLNYFFYDLIRKGAR